MSEEWYNWARDRIGKETGIWFYTDNIQTSYDELKGKSVEISEPEKQAWGGIRSTLKDQDGNKFALISSPESWVPYFFASLHIISFNRLQSRLFDN